MPRVIAGSSAQSPNPEAVDPGIDFASILSNLFDLDVPVGEKLARSLLVFAFLVLALRLAGKREVGQLNVLDIVVLLLVSNALQNAMIGDDDTLVGGMIGASALFVANYFFVRLTYRSRRARELLEGRPTPLFADGRVLEDNLRRQAIRRSELLTIIRERGFADFGDVDGIVLEPNGHIVITRRAEA
jgi:uncharacterized membrane protein YcaP (DUF421 family)